MLTEIKANPPGTKKPKLPSAEERQKVELAWRKYAEEHFLIFVHGLTIASADGPRCFANCMADFQREAFEDVDPAITAIRNGDKPPAPYNRFWWERTKKAGKDSDLAIIVLWLTAFPRRSFYGQIGAADKEQAGIVRKRVVDLLEHNRWLNDYVEIVRWQIRSKQRTASGEPLAAIDIMASEIAGAHGGTPDILILNELSHVTKWPFITALMNNAAGVPRGIVIVATNAGYTGTEAEKWRHAAMTSDNWAVRVRPRPAPWHSHALVREAKKLNARSEYDRLWWGKWVSGTGTALSELAIDRCFCLDGPMDGSETGWVFIAGLDLGVSHDHSAVFVLGVNDQEQRMRSAWFRAFEPLPENDGEVDQIAVEETCRTVYKRFGINWLGYDPAAGGSYMAQRLRRSGVPCREVTFSSPTNRTAMAESLISSIEDGILQCYDDPDGRLRRDLGKFDIQRDSFGVKLKAVSDQFGHADVGVAMTICLPRGRELLGLPGMGTLQPDDAMADVMTDERIEAARDGMPDGLADIYDYCNDPERFRRGRD